MKSDKAKNSFNSCSHWCSSRLEIEQLTIGKFPHCSNPIISTAECKTLNDLLIIKRIND